MSSGRCRERFCARFWSKTIRGRFHGTRRPPTRIRMFLERHRRAVSVDQIQDYSEHPRSMLTEAISAFRTGDLSQTQVARLSDLSRVNARELAAAWQSIPEENRIGLVRRFDELSEERVELNFGRALKVALNDPSAVVRQPAVAGLWEDESSELLERLRDVFENDESPDVRAQAAAALERYAGKAAVGSLDESVARD